jgi:transitional endoplasmic reticulum ATPase
VDRVVSQLPPELDTLDEYSEVTVLGATNRPDLVDPALLSPRRFAYVLELTMPDEEARRDILEATTRKMPLADDVDLELLAARSEGLSGADLASVCQRAALNEIRHLIATDQASEGAVRTDTSGLKIRMKTLEEALGDARHAVTARSSKNGTAGGARVPSAAPAARPV